MATKANNIQALIATGQFVMADFDGESAKAIQELRNEFAPETKDETKSAEITKDEMVATIVANSEMKFETVAKFNDALIGKLYAKYAGDDSGKAETNNGGKATPPPLPDKPKVTETTSDLIHRVREFLMSEKIMPKGHYPYPERAGENKGRWNGVTVWNVAREALSDLGFSESEKWADLFFQGHLDMSEFHKVIRYAIRTDRMKVTK